MCHALEAFERHVLPTPLKVSACALLCVWYQVRIFHRRCATFTFIAARCPHGSVDEQESRTYIERKRLHMRKVSESSYTGNDRVLFYDMGDDVIRVVHLQEWDDIDSSYRREGGEKYNVVAHDVCVYGYDGQRGYLSDEPNDFRKSSVCGWGQSVHDSLRSCGFKLLVNPEGVAGCGNVRIESEQDARLHGPMFMALDYSKDIADNA